MTIPNLFRLLMQSVPRRVLCRACLTSCCVAILGLTVGAVDVLGQSGGGRHALIIGGLGGGAEQSERFERYMFETRSALIERFGFDSRNVVVLGEQSIADRDFVDGVALAETVRAEFAALARRVGTQDQAYIILYGHGSTNGERAFLNIPRRDLSDEDYAGLIAGVEAERVVFVNTASASAPFATTLAGQGTIIMTATRVASQRNETTFPRFFVEALVSPASDQDRDGALSVLEVFRYAAEKTDQSFADAGHIPTENALLEDNGDGKGSRLEELESNGEGNLAAATFLTSRTRLIASVVGTVPDSLRETVEGYFFRREQLTEEIALVKARKAELDEDAYYAALEVLFVELARTEGAIEAAR